jgi:glycosyltransferase involved in cell wall biosynthesis
MPPFTLIQIGMHSDATGGGVDRYFWELNQGLQRTAADLHTLRFFFEKGTTKFNEAPGHLSLGKADSPLSRRLLLLRKRILKTPDFDPSRFVLASHFSLYALPLLPDFSKLAHVIHFHGPWALESSLHAQNKLRVLVKKAVEQLVYRTASSFITDSSAFRNLLTSEYGVRPDKVHAILPGVDTSRFQPAGRLASRNLLSWPGKRRIIFCVRRLVERMGLEALIAAFGSIAAKHPNVCLFIGGQGRLKGELESRISSLGLGDRVRLLGFIPDSLLPAAYQAADFSVVPSASLEGFGLTTLESLACGTPVLVTPVGGLPEVIQPLAPSCIFSGSKSDQIAEGLNGFLVGDLTMPTAAQCVEYVRQFFTWDRVAKQVLTIYENAFQAKNRGKEFRSCRSSGVTGGGLKYKHKNLPLESRPNAKNSQS